MQPRSQGTLDSCTCVIDYDAVNAYEVRLLGVAPPHLAALSPDLFARFTETLIHLAISFLQSA